MNSKIVMYASSILLAAAGIILIFLPQETAAIFEANSSSYIHFQILGSLYLGFSMINWNVKDNIIGGIYGRPIVAGNLAHFLTGAFSLIKLLFINQTQIIIYSTAIYTIFAISFMYLFFTHPKTKLNL